MQAGEPGKPKPSATWVTFSKHQTCVGRAASITQSACYGLIAISQSCLIFQSCMLHARPARTRRQHAAHRKALAWLGLCRTHTHLLPPSSAWHDSQRQRLWCSLVVLVIIVVVLRILDILHNSKSCELAVLQALGQVLINQDTAQGRFLQTQHHYGHMKKPCASSVWGSVLAH